MTEKTGWDMTDNVLAQAFHDANIRTRTDKDLAAAIRALFPRPVPAREAVDAWGCHRAKQGVHQFDGITTTILAALSHFAPPAPARQDVPSVEDIRKKMLADPKASLGALNSFSVCARVAHVMMLELAPRERRAIYGMTVEQINAEMQKQQWAYPPGLTPYDAATVAHRLANTPAPVDDPDAGAKNLAWQYWTAAHGPTSDGSIRNSDHYWATMTEPERNGWRAVAKVKP
jgi:hypothetical protein